MADDDWGCVEPSDLFTSSAKTQSLKLLAEKLQQNISHGNLLNQEREFPEASFSQITEVNILNPKRSDESPQPNGRVVAPKILKKKQGLVERTPSLKRVTFEVERYVIDNLENKDEKQSAETKLAIRLGAKPAKRKKMNYKQLSADQKQAKQKKREEATLEMDQMPALLALNKLSKTKMKKKKK